MKKRIISIILVAVMLFAAIPAVEASDVPEAITKFADYKHYRTVVTSDTVIMDGELDEVYKDSQKIAPEYWLVGDDSKVSFEAYTAVTLHGLYVWAEIKDGSLDKADSISASEADRFQLYIKQNDGRDLAWGWYENDYNGNIAVHSMMDADDIEGTYENNWDCVYGTKELATPEVKTVKLADGSGWRSEIFIPFAVELVNFTNYELSIGVQANNGARGDADYAICSDKEEIINDAWYRCDVYKPIALAKLIDRSPSYSPNYVMRPSDLLVNDDIPLYGELINSAVYATGGFNIDGKKDAKYSEHNKIPLIGWHTYYDDGAARGPHVPQMGYVYTAFDNENLYVYYERYDEELFGQEQLFTMYYLKDEAGNEYSGYLGMQVNYAWFESYTTANYPGTKVDKSSIAYKVATLGNNYYGAEYKMALPEGIKTMLASGKDVEIKLAFYTTQETTVNGERTLINLTSSYPDAYRYAYSAECVEQFIDPNNYGTTTILSKSVTDANFGKIHGANLSLGADISVNYYATIGSGDINNAYMRFTRGDNGEYEYIAYPRKIDGSTQYKFSYKGLAPQTLGDDIKAELVVGGEVVATYDNYSARQNLINLLGEEKYSSNVKMNNLIKSLLNYGAAAQGFANYKNDQPVNKDYELVLNTPKESDSVRDPGSPINANTKITALGVYFDSVNRIYVKFKADSLSGVSVKFNDVIASIEEYDAENNIYIAYSDAIPVTQFHIPYTIVLSSGQESQTATYSVNSYAYAKLDSTNYDMVKLAKATYTYGDCAKKYASLSETVYTVMTYNDADNNPPYKNNYEDVMTIINDCNPDLVGMQEIQRSHVETYYLATNLKNEGDGCYSGEIGDYAGVFYWSTPAEPKREDYPDDEEGQALYERKYDAYNGEVLKPGGDMILYKKDKFEIVKDANGVEVKGRFWFTDTPDVPSILPDTEYTQCVMYLLLRDKQTGKEFLYINAHASYLEANTRQVEIMMELFEEGGAKNSYVQQHAGVDITSYRKIYTADWNCQKFTGGYNVMNDNGYMATEEMLPGSYKPSTTANGGGYIDFCFIKSSEFKTLKYKVINDHPLALLTSDHYPVFSKIAWVEEYDDVLLQVKGEFPTLPNNPAYKEWEDDFLTEDDREGFFN